jgi:hypothetical protein
MEDVEFSACSDDEKIPDEERRDSAITSPNLTDSSRDRVKVYAVIGDALFAGGCRYIAIELLNLGAGDCCSPFRS